MRRRSPGWLDELVVTVVISAIVPVLNGMPWLEDQLAALAAQECDLEWEVVIADNGSTDAGPVLVRQWAERHHRVRWIDASSEPGASAARNAGVRAARGDLLAFCDADDIVHPGWLASCAQALETVDVVAGVFDFWSLNGHEELPPVPASMQQYSFLPAGLSANLAVRRQAFEAVGGFSQELVTGEDIDLCWRLQTEGFRFAVEFGAVVSKRGRPGFVEVFRQGSAFGRGGPVLYRRHRGSGARRNLAAAAKSWFWLVARLPLLFKSPSERNQWARAAGVRTGRLVGSVRERVFFP